MDNDKVSFKFFLAKAKTTSEVRCGCPSSETGIIKCDVSEHEANCWVRKKLVSKKYITDTSVTPKRFVDGYNLGVAI